MDSSAWSTQQLAEFVASVSACTTQAAAARAAAERAAEALDADAAAMVCGGQLLAGVGYPEDTEPVHELARIQPGVPDAWLNVPGAGRCAATAAALAYPPGTTLVLARRTALTRQETGLLRGMARVTEITMRMLSVLDHERAAREEVEHLARDQAALRRVATLVAKASSPEDIFSAVAREVAGLSGADIALVLRYEADDAATLVARWSAARMPVSVGARLNVQGEDVATAVLRTGLPSQADRFTGPPGSVADYLRQAGVLVSSGSPIVVEGRLWGVVITAATRPEGLRPQTERRMPAFTELVATAIANAQARVELRTIAEEQAALRRVATLVARGALPGEVFAAVAHEVGHVLPDADFATIGRYDPGSVVEVVGGWSRAGSHRLVGRRWTLGGRNVNTLVFERNGPARVDHRLVDGSDEVTAAAREFGMRSSVGAPISVEGRPWGVVGVASTRENALPPGTEHRLAEFTKLIATTIANTETRQEVNALASEQAALRRVATLVARGAPPQAVFAAVTEEAGRLLRADVTVLCRYGSDGYVARVGLWSKDPGPVPHGNRIRLGGQTVSTLVFETGRAARIDNFGEGDSPGKGFWLALGVRSAVAVPISVNGRLWGTGIAMATSDEPLAADTEARLAGFTDLVATAIANAEGQAELTASRARIVATADETRRRIERDLHDGAQQRLVTLALQLRAAQAEVPPQLDRLTADLGHVAAGLTNTLDELREYARGIHPAILAKGGLEPALKALARESLIPVTLNIRIDKRLPEQIGVTAYYVISEALANAAKHAKATSIMIDVDTTNGTLRLDVRDDGVGGADPARGSGLIGLKDRVEAIGGTFTVKSRHGEGTRLLVERPAGAAHPASG